MVDLFLRPEILFEKVAAETPLPEDPNTWPQEIQQELFKQVPYIADFTPNVNMVKVDAERGYALGFVDVMNKTELQPSTSPEALQAAGVQRVRIPIIVGDRKLQPFDIVLTEKNKMLPLTEERLSQAIFRPQTFDITSRSPGDMSIVGDLYPPYRQNFGGGGGGGAAMGKQGSAGRGPITLSTIEELRATYQSAPRPAQARFEKWASHKTAQLASAKEKMAMGKLLGELVKKTTDPARMANISRLATSRGAQLAAEGGEAAKKGLKYSTIGNVAAQRLTKMSSILKHILPTINDSDYQKFASVVAQPEVRALMMTNQLGCREALETLSGFQGGAFEKRAAAIPYGIKPDVVQIVATEEGYVVKTARHDVWAPHRYLADRGRLVRDFGTKIALAADQSGAVTVVEGGASEETPETGAGPITTAGVYQVETLDGQGLEGWVIPNLLELDGTPMPIALFTNGEQMAVQGEISGTPSNTEVPLNEGAIQGHGCFARQGPNGLEATIPMEVHATLSNEGEVLYSTTTYDGRPVDVAVQPNIQQITLAPNGHVLIPEDFHWMPLQGEATALVGGSEEVGKTASAMRHLVGSVVVRGGDAQNLSISGALVEKIANEEKEFIDVDQAMFLLGGLGVDPRHAASKIAQAITYHRPVEVRCGRPIKTAGELKGEAKTAAIKTLGALPVLRRELFKEAAALPDPVAVDTVLSLGFINPENMTHFISFLPVLDEAQSKMCELLLGARLGVRDLPVGSLEKAIRSTEEVIKGLKVMAFAQG